MPTTLLLAGVVALGILMIFIGLARTPSTNTAQMVQQRLSVVDQLSSNQQQLALAQDVEAPQLITRAVATKTTARSRRNTVIVAALIGLLLGIVAALLWEPVGRIASRPA